MWKPLVKPYKFEIPWILLSLKKPQVMVSLVVHHFDCSLLLVHSCLRILQFHNSVYQQPEQSWQLPEDASGDIDCSFGLRFPPRGFLPAPVGPAHSSQRSQVKRASCISTRSLVFASSCLEIILVWKIIYFSHQTFLWKRGHDPWLK